MEKNKNNNFLVVFGIFLLVVLIIVNKSLLVVDQTHYALLMRLGKPIKVIKTPGLNLKFPFVEYAYMFENRMYDLFASEKEIIAADQKRLIVTAFAKFQIVDALKYYSAFKGVKGGLTTRLKSMFESSLRQIVGGVDFTELLSKQRSEVMQKIENDLNSKVKEFGIYIKDVRIMRADLPAENSSAIYRRMQTERELEAKQIRAEGEEEAKKIIANTDKEVAVILAEAKKKADILKGEGESEVTRLINKNFGKDMEFYNFYKSMQIYKEVINKDNTNLIITPNNQFFNELKL